MGGCFVGRGHPVAGSKLRIGLVRKCAKIGSVVVVLVGLCLLIGAGPASRASSRPTSQTSVSVKTTKASTLPLLYVTAYRIAKRIHWQESRKDATCWTTVRMMEHFYARKALESRASWLKIEATKLLIYQLWRKASQRSPRSVLSATDIDGVTPTLLIDSLQILGQRRIPKSSSVFYRVKLRDYHKVTENWRMLLAISMDSFVGEGVFAGGYVDVKPLSLPAAEKLANLSTALTIALLQSAHRSAVARKHRDIMVDDVKRAYKALLQPLQLKGLFQTKPRFRVKIGDKERGYRLLRSLTLTMMKGKVRALRSWNKKVWESKHTKTRLLSLLQRLTTLKLTPRDLQALVRYIRRTFLPYALGATVRESISQAMPSLGLQNIDPVRFHRSNTRQAPTRPKYLTFLWMANNLASLFPFETKHNGDVVYRAVGRAEEKTSAPSSQPSVKPPSQVNSAIALSKRMITGPDLDAVRDTTVHWFALLQLWENQTHARAFDPFAGELLSERTSELVLFLLREAEAYAKRQKAKNSGHSDLYPLEAYLRQAFLLFLPAHREKQVSAWNAAHQKKKAKLLRSYSFGLFQEIKRGQAGLKKRACPLPKAWIERYRLEPPSLEKRKKIPPTKVDQTHLGLQVWMGSGVAVGDYDNDGKVDLFFAGDGCNRLYRNLGQHRFQDVTEKVGIRGLHPDSRQVLFVDVNNDRRLDLFVLHSAKPARLFVQTQAGQFRDITKASNIRTTMGAHTATFFDYDNDGRLDLYIGYYGAQLARDGQQPVVDGANGRPNVLYRNLGGGRFEDVSRRAGVNSRGWTLAVSSLDVDQNGTMDLWLANDFGFDQLYLNRGDGTFQEVAQKAETNDRGSGMNVSFTDINRDGYWDVYISVIDMFSKSIRFILPQPKSLINIDQRILQTSFYLSGNKFFVSQGKGQYKAQEHHYFEPGSQGWSWSAVFFDYENDGDDDMYLANGWRNDAIAAKQRNRFFVQDGRYFYAHPGPSPALYKGNSRSAAAVDLNGTGKLDLVLNDFETGPRLFQNTNTSKHNWLGVRLQGAKSNSYGVGATVLVEAKGVLPQRKQVTCGLNYLSQHDTTLHFGLKQSKRIDKVVVLWPDGHRQTLQGPIRVNQILTVRESRSR